MKFSEASSSPKADDEVSAIAIDPINVADTVTTLAAPTALSTPVARGIIVQEPTLAKPSPKRDLESKGKKKQREVSVTRLEESTPSSLRRARMDA